MSNDYKGTNEVQAKDFSLDSIFKGLPSETERSLKLPSKCLFYKNKDLKIRAIQWEDEKLIASSKNDPEFSPTNFLLARCIKGVDAEDLLLIDKLAALIALRVVSYGPIYNVIGVCQSCKAENDLSVNLEEIPQEELPDDFKDPREVITPKLNLKVKIRSPRAFDEDILKDETSLFDNLWKFILSVNDNEDKAFINSVINDPRMPIKDIKFILKNIITEYGIKTKTKFICRNCGFHNVVDLPLGADFFSGN